MVKEKPFFSYKPSFTGLGTEGSKFPGAPEPFQKSFTISMVKLFINLPYRPNRNPRKAFARTAAGPIECFNKLFHHGNGEGKALFFV